MPIKLLKCVREFPDIMPAKYPGKKLCCLNIISQPHSFEIISDTMNIVPHHPIAYCGNIQRMPTQEMVIITAIMLSSPGLAPIVKKFQVLLT